MTLKARLTAALAAIIVLAAAVLGFVAVRTVESSLLDQLDRRLRDAAAKPLQNPPPRPDGDADAEPPALAPATESESGIDYKAFAQLLYRADGTLLTAIPSGFSAEPDPLPEIPTDRLTDLIQTPTTITSADGEVEFRAIAVRLPGDRIQVLADATDEERAVVVRVRNLALLGGLIVGLVAATTSWYVIRRELQPVDRMIDTAGRIAEGDLSQRIEPQRAGTELESLARALDEMIGELESAFADRQLSADRLRRFAADASHELRTPLTVIGGYAELYRRGGISQPDALDTAFERIESETARMTRLVEDLLLLARLDQQLPLDRSTVDLEPLIRDAGRDLSAVDPSRPVTVTAQPGVMVTGDEQRLRQVVGNLVSNAVRHTPAGTPVHLSAAIDRDEAVLSVADEGPGIAPELRDRVFERFYRIDKSRRAGESESGAGLGLSIVARLVDAHRGTVELVDGDEPGASFRVRLPLEQAARS